VAVKRFRSDQGSLCKSSGTESGVTSTVRCWAAQRELLNYVSWCFELALSLSAERLNLSFNVERWSFEAFKFDRDLIIIFRIPHGQRSNLQLNSHAINDSVIGY